MSDNPLLDKMQVIQPIKEEKNKSVTSKTFTPEKEIKLRNIIEEQLIPKPMEQGLNGSDLFLLEQAEIQKKKVEILETFVSGNVYQKTEITAGERKILPVLNIMATSPFPSLVKRHPELKEALEMPTLTTYLKDYLTFGIPVGRKGRKEEVEILRTLFNNDSSSIEMGKDGNYSPKKFD